MEEQRITLSNPHNNSLTQEIINLLGTEVTVETEHLPNGEVIINNMQSLNNSHKDIVLELNSTTWTVVSSAFMHDSHLVLIASNDDGDIMFSPTISEENSELINVLTNNEIRILSNII